MRCEIIAEIGNTHEGSLGLAKCFVKEAAECGADTIKFQLHIFDAESLPTAPNPPYFDGESREDYFNRTSFSITDWKELKRFSEEDCKVNFLVSPFSIEAVEILEEIGVQSYKVPSGEVTNLPLLEKIASTGKKILISSGMSSYSEINAAIKVFINSNCKDIVVLQCTSEYPCPPERSGLNVIDIFKSNNDIRVGFSDHTLGSEIAIAALVKGCKVIEKHFTLSKKMYGSDAKNSMNPHEFKNFVRSIRNVELALNNNIDKDNFTDYMLNMKATFEKSIVSSTSLDKGTTISLKHLAFKKPGDGLSSKEYKKIIGKKLAKKVPKDYVFKREDFLDGF